ncbi:MAG: hypothetical protein ACI93R_003552, partial [Flavobacteriales bacterium]
MARRSSVLVLYLTGDDPMVSFARIVVALNTVNLLRASFNSVINAITRHRLQQELFLVR